MSSKPHTFKARIAFDAILSALLVVEMFFQLTGDFLHEVLGVVFFICIAAHLVLSRAWIAGTSAAIKGKRMTARRWLLAIMGILLALAMIALVVSSLMISQVLSSAGISLAVAGTGEVWYLVHVASSYLLCALVVVHLAMHWIAVASVFKVPYNPARRKAIGAAVNTVAVVGVVALGDGLWCCGRRARIGWVPGFEWERLRQRQRIRQRYRQRLGYGGAQAPRS